MGSLAESDSHHMNQRRRVDSPASDFFDLLCGLAFLVCVTTPACGGRVASDVAGGTEPCGSTSLSSTQEGWPFARSLPPPPFSSEFAPCSTSSDCGCELECVSDPVFAEFDGAGGACEQGCSTSSDCSDPTTVCSNGSCTLDFCAQALGGQAAPGTFGQPCDAGGTSGTCQVVYQNDNYGTAFGVCIASGVASGSCTVGATRDQPDALCSVGSLCLGNTYEACGDAPTGPPFCAQVCDVTQSGQCPSGTTCMAWAPEYPQGNCFPPDLTFGLCR